MLMSSQPTAGMVYGTTQMWYSWTDKYADIERDHIRALGVQPNRLYQPLELVEPFVREQAMTSGICSLLIRREVLARVGGLEVEFRGMYEDQVLIAKICLETPVFVTNECWSRYRQHQDSACSVASSKGEYSDSEPSPARGRYLFWLNAYLAERAIHAPGVQAALDAALQPYRQPVREQLRRRANLVSRRLRSAPKAVALRLLPGSIKRWLAWHLLAMPPVGRVRFGDLRRTTPFSQVFGYDRGQPIDRYYIERFLDAHSLDVHGRVLEIGDNSYTCRFGGIRVSHSDVLHALDGYPQATFVGDLTDAPQIPSDAFDCIILTQTLHLIYEPRLALQTIYRILRPGGVLLATVPGISQISYSDWSDTWYWSFTPVSMQRMAGEVFSPSNVLVEVEGNVFAASALLYGLSSHELRSEDLDYRDPYFPVTIAIRAIKPVVIS
jgi:hypothetical protein